jgi:CRP/FNR family transcriptional regulator
MALPPESNIVSLSQLKVACGQCMLSELCLPIGIDGEDLEQLDQIIHRSRPLKRGEHLFRQGDAFRAIYAVRSGSLKTYTVSDDGAEQITGFFLPGELVGLDAITAERHPGSARALETTSFCEIPFDQLEDLSGRLPSLRKQLLRLMSKEIVRDQDLLMLLAKKTAEERLAALLISLSTRFRERGFSASEFNLSMARNDIANYLGLAVETVSRLFTRFQEQGLLQANGKHVQILDLPALRVMSGACENARNSHSGRS